jgi:hypothetical protein
MWAYYLALELHNFSIWPNPFELLLCNHDSECRHATVLRLQQVSHLEAQMSVDDGPRQNKENNASKTGYRNQSLGG